MKTMLPQLLVFGFLLTFPATMLGWTRAAVEDTKLVKQSELIVVGRLKPGTIVFVPKPEGRSGWEHRVTLIVKEVMKGECKEKEIPIIIHYGLDPLVGGEIKLEGRLEIRRGDKAVSRDAIEIRDTGGRWKSDPVVKDAREDNIWFLRKSNGPFGRGTVANEFGVVEPGEIQPTVLKDFYHALLATDTEKEMKALLKKAAPLAKAAQCYLDIQTVRRTAELPDVDKRAELLVAWYAKSRSYKEWTGPGSSQKGRIKWYSERGIENSGRTAGPHLVKLFEKEPPGWERCQIIYLLERIEYTEAAPLFVELLLKYDTFWSEQKLKSGWWNDDTDAKLWEKRSNIAHETERLLYGIAALGDHNARDAVQATLKRWRAIEPQPPKTGTPPPIITTAEFALKQINAKSK